MLQDYVLFAPNGNWFHCVFYGTIRLSTTELMKSWTLGDGSKGNGKIMRAAIKVSDDFILHAPIVIPDVADVVAFAERLHAEGEAWEGIAFGWDASYEPVGPPPKWSKATETPASFCVGDATAWCCCITWEHGDSPTVIVTDSLERSAE